MIRAAQMPLPVHHHLCFVCHAGGANKFWSYRLDGCQVAIEHGVIGGKSKTETKTLLTPDKAQDFVRTAISAKLAKGYYSDTLQFEEKTWADLGTELRVPGNAEAPEYRVLVFNGDLVVPHGLWLDYQQGLLALRNEEEPPIAGLLVRGTLTVEGCLTNYENDFGPFLQVEGDLTAHAIAMGGSRVVVAGNVSTGEFVGAYNHGSFEVEGNLSARVVATQHRVSAAGRFNALRFTGGDSRGVPVCDSVEHNDTPYETKGVFVSSLLRDSCIDLQKARAMLDAGKPITLASFTSIRDTFRKLVAKKLDAPLEVKKLSLKQKGLTSLPEELLMFPALEVLDLSDNALRSLPENIGQLTELRELRLNGNDLQTLPSSIGQLSKLEILDLGRNCIWHLPGELAQCTSLHTLVLDANPHHCLLRGFGNWQNVRIMESVPDALTYLPVLTTLKLNHTLVRNLPQRAFDSPTLKIQASPSLITQVDKALHPQVDLDTAENAKWAEKHVDSLFSRGHYAPWCFCDEKTGLYDFTNVTGILKHLFEILVPTTAPYQKTLESFKAQSDDIITYINLGGEEPHHIRALFTALRQAMETLGKPYPGNPLITGLTELFATLSKYKL